MRFQSWDDYYIPGTQVLRNLLGDASQPHGEMNQKTLTAIEASLTAGRMAELSANPLSGNFDYVHFKAIHRYIFQDIYEWAGEERVAPTGRWMTKAGHAYYPAGPSLTQAAEAQFRKLARQDFLRGLPHHEFVAALAEVWGEINVIHPFREGNTRTQVVFFADLTRQAGHTLDPSAFLDPEIRSHFVAARFHSQDTGDNTKLAELLDRIVS